MFFYSSLDREGGRGSGGSFLGTHKVKVLKSFSLIGLHEPVSLVAQFIEVFQTSSLPACGNAGGLGHFHTLPHKFEDRSFKEHMTDQNTTLNIIPIAKFTRQKCMYV